MTISVIQSNIFNAWKIKEDTIDLEKIGIAGDWGFGVGICPNDATPDGFTPLPGYKVKKHGNYGNYMFLDGSVMVFIPAFYYKWGTGSNGLVLNEVDIKPFSEFTDRDHAALSGYAIHRAFVDGGQLKAGVFVDKYNWSAKNYNGSIIASSVKNGNPLSSNAGRQGWGSLLTGLTTADNIYAGALKAAKTRGPQFFCNTRFIWSALAMLSYAHGRSSSNTDKCSWYLTNKVFPKGNNSNTSNRNDVDDVSLKYKSSGYDFCALTGSANVFSKTTHNGQNSGVCDINGNIWDITPGLTSDGKNFFILKESVSVVNLTSGTTLETDIWSAFGLVSLHDNLGSTYESAIGRNGVTRYGSTNQTFSTDTFGNGWAFAGLGGMLATGTSSGGTSSFGVDGFWDYKPNTMCPISGGYWSFASLAGVWSLYCYTVRGTSNVSVGGRAACYFD